MKVMLTTLATAVAVLALGCGGTEQLETQLAETQNHVAALDSALVEARHANEYIADSLEEVIANVQLHSDSVVQSFKYGSAAVQHKLLSVKNDYKAITDSLAATRALYNRTIESYSARIAGIEAALASEQSETGKLTIANDSLRAFISDVHPWYSYYKHEAHRNWLKKLFGAGDATRPGSDEPTFDTTIIEPLELVGP